MIIPEETLPAIDRFDCFHNSTFIIQPCIPDGLHFFIDATCCMEYEKIG